MKFSIQRPTYKQKLVRARLKPVPRPPTYRPLPNTKTPDPRVRFTNPTKLGNTQLPKARSGVMITKLENTQLPRARSGVVIRKLPDGSIGRNHPDEKLVVPEPLFPKSCNVPSMCPITINRK